MLDNNDPAQIRTYIDAAEHYFRVLERPEVLFNKPYVPLSEAPFALARLSGMLHHLHLGPNHVVLDFGAGMCWLSGVLARIGCRPIAVDVSEAALRLGAKALRDLSQGPSGPPVQFKTFDGFTFDIPSESVDRVACFDALHHVPNKTRVLTEMFRVLKPGGRVCFAEPGPGHADSDESLRESQRYGVLEDEVDPGPLTRMAHEIGFAESYLVPIGEPGGVAWSPEDEHLAEGAITTMTCPVRGVLIVLRKGHDNADSRSPARLEARVDVVAPVMPVMPGAEFAVTVRVNNVGDTRWLALPETPERPGARPLDYVEAFLRKHIVPGTYVNREPVECYRRYIEDNGLQGTVTVGACLLGSDGTMIDRDYARGFLGRDIPPGDQTDVTVRMIAPATPGLYGLVFDPVDEYVGWFEDLGSKAVRDYLRVEGTALPRDSRDPGLLQCRLAVSGLPVARRIVVEVTNTGDTIWLAGLLSVPGEVMLGIQALAADGTVVNKDWRRVPLPGCVLPGETVAISVNLAQERARFGRVRLDMVAEGLSWFEHMGSVPVELELPAR
jgi:SAM-dependent methyltransferase